MLCRIATVHLPRRSVAVHVRRLSDRQGLSAIEGSVEEPHASPRGVSYFRARSQLLPREGSVAPRRKGRETRPLAGKRGDTPPGSN
jgi:hypothetical protein